MTFGHRTLAFNFVYFFCVECSFYDPSSPCQLIMNFIQSSSHLPNTLPHLNPEMLPFHNALPGPLKKSDVISPRPPSLGIPSTLDNTYGAY